MEVTEFFSVKGGQGCTVTACGYALERARGARVLLVDLSGTGDCAAVLGTWGGFRASGEVREVVTFGACAGLYVCDGVPADGGAGFDVVVIDAGAERVDGECTWWGEPVRNVLVTRACYLALRAAVASDRPSPAVAAVLVLEDGRSLGVADVERALGVSVVATVKVGPVVARAVDAGLLATRLPAELKRLAQDMDRRAAV